MPQARHATRAQPLCRALGKTQPCCCARRWQGRRRYPTITVGTRTQLASCAARQIGCGDGVLAVGNRTQLAGCAAPQVRHATCAQPLCRALGKTQPYCGARRRRGRRRYPTIAVGNRTQLAGCAVPQVRHAPMRNHYAVHLANHNHVVVHGDGEDAVVTPVVVVAVTAAAAPGFG